MHRSWIYISLSFLSSCSIVHAFSFSNSTTVSYTDHCSSTVPQSIANNSTSKNFIPRFVTPHFTGGESLLRRKTLNHADKYAGTSLLLELQPKFYKTDTNGIFKVEASLYILYKFPHYYAPGYAGYFYENSKVEKAITFLLEGFWSQISGNLCMVGSAYLKVEGGRLINLDAVLKLNYAGEEYPTVYTSLVSGILESTLSANDDPGYFDSILIYSFPVFPNYTYSLFHKEDFLNDCVFPKDRSFSLESTSFCSVVAAEQTILELDYAVECREAWHCSPLDSGLCEFLPPFLLLIPLQCSEGERKVRYLAKYRDDMIYSRTFRHDWTLIVEASWDYETHQLFGFGCRILNPTDYLLGNAVRDCTTRLSLRYPSILNIRNIEATIIGQIWSSKSVEDSGYFRKIDLTGTNKYHLMDQEGFGYEYTELDRARKSCSTTKSGMNGETYPDGESYAMSTTFYFSVKGQRCGSGSAVPIFIGSKIFELDYTAPPENLVRSQDAPALNISYKITINLFLGVELPDTLYDQMMITAEGVYDSNTGTVCMVGCRKIKNCSIYIETDCDILVRFKFASLRDYGQLLEGTIESSRTTADPLHFPDLSLSSAVPEVTLHSTMWRLNAELTMLWISNALSCTLVWLQIRHVRRHPEVASSVSFLVLLILSLGNIISVAFNFEVMFPRNNKNSQNNQTLQLSFYERLTDKETSMLVSMIELSLHMRLLHIVWTAKSNQNKAWIREKTASFVSLSCCILLSLLNNSTSYASLMMDAFLVPQIVLNIVRNAADKTEPLSAAFYVGTSVLRLAPRAYNEYRERSYPTWFDGEETYYYANPAAGFYSTAWDIIVPCGIIAFALIVCLQQRYGCLHLVAYRCRTR